MSLFDRTSTEYINFKQNELNSAIEYLKNSGIDENFIQQARNFLADYPMLTYEDAYNIFSHHGYNKVITDTDKAASALQAYHERFKSYTQHEWGNDEVLPITKDTRYSVNPKDDDLIEFFNGSSKTKAEKFLSTGLGGTGLENGAIIETPNGNIISSEGLQVMKGDYRAAGYAKRAAEWTDDVPVIVKGKIKAKYLYGAENYTYEYGIPRQFYDQLEDVQVFNANTGYQIGAYHKGKAVDFDRNNKTTSPLIQEFEYNEPRKTETYSSTINKEVETTVSKNDVIDDAVKQSSKNKYTAKRGPRLKTKEYGQSDGKFTYNKDFGKTQSAKSQYTDQQLNKWWSNFKTTEDGSLVTNINGENVVLKDWEFTTLEGKGTFLRNKVTGELINQDLQRVGKNGSLYSLKGELLADASENSAIVDVEYKEIIGNKRTTVSRETAEKIKRVKLDHTEAVKKEVESVNTDNIKSNLEEISKSENAKISTNGADNVVDKVENDIKKEYDFSAKKDEIRERLSKDRRRRYNKQHPNDAFQVKTKDTKEVLHEKIGDRRDITKSQYKQGQHEVRDEVRKLKKKIGENFVREDVEDIAFEAVKKMKPKMNMKVLGIAAAAAAVVGITAYGIGKSNNNKKKKAEAHKAKVKEIQKQIDYNMASNNKSNSMSWQQPYLQKSNQQMINDSNAMQMAKDISSYRYGKKMTGFV